ncbi:MAG: hypothetical protein R2727_04300 [Bacteroidales bacterium]
MKTLKVLPLILLILAAGNSLNGQKRDLTQEDYANWQNLGQFSLSDNGSWVGWRVSLVEGDDTLYVKGIGNGKSYKYPLVNPFEFSADGKWLAGRVNLGEEEQEKDEGTEKGD